MPVPRFTEAERERRYEFLVNRQKGVGGSDIPRIVGVSSYGNALDVYYEKTRPIDKALIDDDTIHQMRGHQLEGTALAHYWLHTGRRGRATGIVVSHPDFPNVRVRRDFEVFAESNNLPEGAEGTGTGELKAPVSAVFGKVISDGLRESEIVQLQTNIAASRHQWGSIAYFSLEHSKGPITYADLLADEALGQFLLEQGQRFWDEHVVPRIPPDPNEWAHLMQRADAPPIYELNGEVDPVVDDEPLVTAIAKEIELKELKKEAESVYRTAQSTLFDLMVEREARKVHAAGVGKATVVTSKGREKLLEDTLRNAMPLDRDKVERWLRESGGGPYDPADVGRMLFECTLDIDQFKTRGEPSQHVRTYPSKEVS